MRSLLLALAILGLGSACAAAQSGSVPAADNRPVDFICLIQNRQLLNVGEVQGPAADTSLFAVVVEGMDSLILGDIRVDPRPLRSVMNAAEPDSVFGRTDSEDLMLDSAAVEQLVPFDIVIPDSSALARVLLR